MKILKIEINNYKSIKEPVFIHFTDSLPTVIIGKNGSGKTNILEALSIIAEANGSYWGINKKQAFDYKIFIKLWAFLHPTHFSDCSLFLYFKAFSSISAQNAY